MNFDEELKKIYDTNDANLEMWSGHRRTISNIIDKRVKEILGSGSNKSIAIWGAGKCYDIDLNYLCNNFEKVTLLDMNEDLMIDALNLQNVKNKKNIEIIKVDFLINTNEVYNNFFNLVMKKPSIYEMKNFLETMKSDIIKQGAVFNELDEYNINVCLGVHSQLLGAISLSLMTLKEFYNENDINDLIELFYTCQGEAAKKLNQLIINHSSDLLLIGLDLMELSNENNTMQFYNQIQNKLCKNEIADAIEIAMQRSVSGAKNAAEDIREYVLSKKLDINAINCWIWPYDNKKQYVFALYTLKK